MFEQGESSNHGQTENERLLLSATFTAKFGNTVLEVSFYSQDLTA